MSMTALKTTLECSGLHFGLCQVEPTDFKNIIIENIPPALSLSHRKQKRPKFYNKKS